MISDWIYMCNDDAFDNIASLLSKDYDVEVWKELGILEINKDGTSVDFEIIPEKRWDDYCREYINEINLNCMYQISVGKGADKWANEMMLLICKEMGGRFCADTDNLEPVIE